MRIKITIVTGNAGVLSYRTDRIWNCISRRSRIAQLSRIATHAGKNTEHLVKDAALRLEEEQPGGDLLPPLSAVPDTKDFDGF
jgi:hypothetical protein